MLQFLSTHRDASHSCSALWEKLAPMYVSVTSETTIRRAPSRKARNKAARLVRPIKEKSIVPGATTLLESPPHLCALRSSHAPHAPAGQTHIEGLLCHLGRGFSNGKYISYFYKILNIVVSNFFIFLQNSNHVLSNFFSIWKKYEICFFSHVPMPLPPCPCLTKSY